MTRSEHGGATVEITLLSPLLIMFMLLVVLCGRTVTSKMDVEGAASDAARAASLERDPVAAVSAARSSVDANVEEGNVTCRSVDVFADTSQFHAGGSVAVQVRCVLDLGDLSMLRIPGSKVVQARSVEAIDRYRGASA